MDRLAALLERGEITIGGEPAGLIAARARRCGLIWSRGDLLDEFRKSGRLIERAKAKGWIRPLTKREIRQRLKEAEETPTLTQGTAVD